MTAKHKHSEYSEASKICACSKGQTKVKAQLKYLQSHIILNAIMMASLLHLQSNKALQGSSSVSQKWPVW